jgi:hypothetical protein
MGGRLQDYSLLLRKLCETRLFPHFYHGKWPLDSFKMARKKFQRFSCIYHRFLKLYVLVYLLQKSFFQSLRAVLYLRLSLQRVRIIQLPALLVEVQDQQPPQARRGIELELARVCEDIRGQFVHQAFRGSAGHTHRLRAGSPTQRGSVDKS